MRVLDLDLDFSCRDRARWRRWANGHRSAARRHGAMRRSSADRIMEIVSRYITPAGE